ncbi:MAG TPA: NlpC/P60 family protein [Blastococcus sp.]|nr:NlpC/P60 family protein [Blastococcus sp.]
MPASRTPSRTSSRPGSRSATGGRPVISAREAQALREAIALRQALAEGRTLTPAQADGLRTAAAAAVRTAAAGTGTRKPAARKPARKPATRKPATRKARGKAARPAPQDRPRSRWSTRLGVVAMSTLLLPAVASMVLPGGQDGGQGGNPLDVTSLALTAQSSLLEQAGRYRQLEQEVTQRRAELQQAHEAEQAALAQVTADQQVVGSTAADLYRAGAVERYPLLGLSVHAPSATSDVLYRSALADLSDRELEGAVVRAERTGTALAAAAERVARAEEAIEVATDRAEAVLAKVRAKVDDLSPEVSARLAGLSAIPAAGEQQDRNQKAMQRWQDYLTTLAAAGIEAPPAAGLADLADLPPGMSPALDAAGRPIPGVAWAVAGNRPVTVLPAETVAAVSTALSQLGKPFVPGTSGPDSYDCGGFTSASWLLAGYAVPTSPQTQWAAGAPVAVTDLQVGDLVFAPGGEDVGIYLGDGDVVGASAGTFQVGVRSVAAGSSATRVTLPAPAQANAALPPGGDRGACGAALPAPGPVTPAWGGWSNGQIPGEALCALGVGRHALRCDAAAAYGRMSAEYATAFGTPLCITDSYRSLAGQVSAFARKPALAAVPGTSNHGWALAVDLCGGIHIAHSAQWNWMTANAGRFGFVQPEWARPGGEKPEPWHWEFGYIS